MDYIRKIREFLVKYRYALLVLLVGLVLMLLPTGSDSQTKQPITDASPSKELDVTQELTQILASIQGVGKVQVMLTVEEGEKTVYQYDEKTSGKDTVIITDGNREETGLVYQVISRKYRGAVVVCQGADSASVRLSIIEAVAKVTGLGTDRISVLKMK